MVKVLKNLKNNGLLRKIKQRGDSRAKKNKNR